MNIFSKYPKKITKHRTGIIDKNTSCYKEIKNAFNKTLINEKYQINSYNNSKEKILFYFKEIFLHDKKGSFRLNSLIFFIVPIFLILFSYRLVNFSYNLINNTYLNACLVILFLAFIMLKFYKVYKETPFIDDSIWEENEKCIICSNNIKLKNAFIAGMLPDELITPYDFFNFFPCCSKKCCIEFYKDSEINDATVNFYLRTVLPQNYYKRKE